jgi:hypothetical protein
VNNLWRKTALTGFVWFLSHNVSQMDEKKIKTHMKRQEKFNNDGKY